MGDLPHPIKPPASADQAPEQVDRHSHQSAYQGAVDTDELQVTADIQLDSVRRGGGGPTARRFRR